QLMAEYASYRFDITSEIPVRAVMYRLSALEHVLLLLIHHIAADGWSMAPLARDVSVAYAANLKGETPNWTGLPVTYSNYVEWQTELLGNIEVASKSLLNVQLEYWQTQLAGLPDELNIPRDRARPALPSYRGAQVNFSLDAELQKKV